MNTTIHHALATIVGDNQVITSPKKIEIYCQEPRQLFDYQAQAVVLPQDVNQLSALLAWANRQTVRIIPQGGNTGLVGGQVPTATDQHAIIVNLSRLNAIRATDPENNTMTVEAGVILANVHQAARQVERMFPLSLASEGSCQIGGNLATNAGGITVLRYGNMRSQVLGLEVVLADGRIWSNLNGLRKDNTGYDLKQLFIGSEGTLGIISAATLALQPQPVSYGTALIAVHDCAMAVALFHDLQRSLSHGLSSVELLPRIGFDLLSAHMQLACPLEATPEWALLVEFTAYDDQAQAHLTAALANTDSMLITDAVIAQSEQQRLNLWKIRESLPACQKFAGASIKHDVAVPISQINRFITTANAAVTAILPGIRPVAFGHIGDGNIHYNLSQPIDYDRGMFLRQWQAFNRVVHDIVSDLGGSISAEHGIGQLKQAELRQRKSSVEIDLFTSIKRSLDPKNILNPGKVIALSPST